MPLSREENGAGQTLHRISWVLFSLGIFCATWRGLEIFTGGNEGSGVARAYILEPKGEEGGLGS